MTHRASVCVKTDEGCSLQQAPTAHRAVLIRKARDVAVSSDQTRHTAGVTMRDEMDTQIGHGER